MRIVSRIASLVAVAALTLMSSVSVAQAATAALNVNWVLPTQGCIDPPVCTQNVALTGAYALTSIKLYVSTSPIPDNSSMAASAVLGAGASTTSYNATVANGDTLYVRVKATNAFGDSVFSSEVSKVVTVPAKPGAPTSVTVTLTIS